MIPWWTDQQAGFLGGILGSAVGILGGILGTVTGVCAPRGKCKPFVYALFAFMIGIGIIALIASLTALCLHQPYAVYYPLTLIGVLCPTIGGGLVPVVRRTYRQADNRRLEAEELRRS